ncbi:YwaF family protein [Cohnella mopanensis]|uniref:YwaF family protein n=1 Tax=Cohnella mopanensis TaxID=2911966 RepID=UPI001EF79EF6|nr:TIGR02206 family membrane protein [Cohnella mopanensis]
MTFEPFSLAHGLGLAMASAIVIGFIIFRKRLRSKRANRNARYALVAVLVGCELSLQFWYGLTDNWGLYSLPFQLCSIMMWLSALLLLTRNRKLYEITFFLGIMGAMQALLTPNLDATYPEFRYFHFFIAHGAIIGSSVFLTVIEGYRPTVSSVFRAIGWLHVLAIPAAITNSVAGTNFMFLARKPDTASLLDLLAPWPWYLLQLELVALLLCFSLLGLVKVLDRWLLVDGNSNSGSDCPQPRSNS